MTIQLVATILGAYVSLLIELVILRVPSVASSLNIWSPTQALVANFSAKYQRVFRFGRSAKLILFAIPLLIVYAVYCYPFLIIWIGPDPLGDYVFGTTPVSDRAAILLIALGRALSFGYLLTIRRGNEQPCQSMVLHTKGIFGWSRNPGLVGMYVFVLGMWLSMPAASMLLGILVYAIYMDFKVRMEEDFLKNRFGQQYVDYKLKTGRYIP